MVWQNLNPDKGEHDGGQVSPKLSKGLAGTPDLANAGDPKNGQENVDVFCLWTSRWKLKFSIR